MKTPVVICQKATVNSQISEAAGPKAVCVVYNLQMLSGASYNNCEFELLRSSMVGLKQSTKSLFLVA